VGGEDLSEAWIRISHLDAPTIGVVECRVRQHRPPRRQNLLLLYRRRHSPLAVPPAAEGLVDRHQILLRDAHRLGGLNCERDDAKVEAARQVRVDGVRVESEQVDVCIGRRIVKARSQFAA
jgi:hypothetical protein